MGGSTSTALAIDRCLGTDCTDEFLEIHSLAQRRLLEPYYIGGLRRDDAAKVASGPAGSSDETTVPRSDVSSGETRSETTPTTSDESIWDRIVMYVQYLIH
jgi:hypothetical protein